MSQESTALDALEEAIGIAGGQSPFGRGIGMSQQRLWYYVSKRKPLPAEFVLKAEDLTGVPRHRLRPDIYPTPSPAEAA